MRKIAPALLFIVCALSCSQLKTTLSERRDLASDSIDSLASAKTAWQSMTNNPFGVDYEAAHIADINHRCANDICQKKSTLFYTEIQKMQNEAITLARKDPQLKQRLTRAISRSLQNAQYNSLQHIHVDPEINPEQDLSTADLHLLNKLANLSFFYYGYQITRRQHLITVPDLLESEHDFEHVDRAALLETLSYFASKERAWITEALNSPLLSDFDELRYRTTLEKLAHYLSYTHPKLHYLNAIQEALKECRAFIGSFKNSKLLSENLIQREFPICSGTGNVQGQLIETRFLEELSSVYFLHILVKPENDTILAKKHVNWKVEIDSYLRSTRFTEDEQFTRMSAQDIEAHSKHIADDCIEQIAAAYIYAPNAKEIIGINQLITQIKKITPQLIPFKKESNRRYLNKELRKIQFRFLQSQDDLISSLEKQILNTYTRISDDKQIKADFLLNLVSGFMPKMTGEEERVTGGIGAYDGYLSGLCDYYKEEALTDHVLPDQGASYLSWVTVKYPQQTFGIIAHEFGHYVSRILMDLGYRRDAFNPYRIDDDPVELWQRRQCISTFHKSSRQTHPPHPDHRTESFFTEEDWADYFGGKISVELNKTGKDYTNFACILIEQRGDRNISPLIRSKSEQNSYNTHSADLFRLIHVEKTMNKKIPNSCQQSLQFKELPGCF